MHEKVSFKILDDRIHEWGLPSYGTPESAGVDLRACLPHPLDLRAGCPAALVPTGLAVSMPHDGMCAFITSRSGLGHKQGLVVGQGVGTIDADYAAELFVSLWLRPDGTNRTYRVEPGERIAQLVFLPIVRASVAIVASFDRDTARADGGFGSTGRF